MVDLALQRDEFEILRGLIRDHSGIWLNDHQVRFLALRLKERMASRGLSSVRDYVRLLQYDPAGPEEMDRLVDTVAVKETYFFRESDQLFTFRDELLPQILTDTGKRGAPELTLWSCGCSTGEEPYSIAMLLADVLKGPAAAQVHILATDLSETVLTFAQQALYDSYTLRKEASHYIDTYFHREADGRYRVHERIRRMVRFERVNLMDEAAIRAIRNMDGVFCRNVLMYFDQASKERAAAHLYAALKQGGYALLWHAESFRWVPMPFEPVRCGDGVVYRKP